MLLRSLASAVGADLAHEVGEVGRKRAAGAEACLAARARGEERLAQDRSVFAVEGDDDVRFVLGAGQAEARLCIRTCLPCQRSTSFPPVSG